jgi:hypothetical protein
LRLVLLAAAVALVVLGLVLVASAPRRIGRKIRAVAAERGLDARWTSLRLRPPFRIAARGVVLTRAGADTIARIDSLDVDVDPLSVLLFSPRATRLSAGSVVVSLREPRAAAVDTVAPAPRGRERRLRTNQLPRIRRSAERLVRLLLTPPDRLPQLSLRDVTVRPGTAGPDDDDAETLHFDRLELLQETDGSLLRVSGETRLARPVPFQAGALYARDGRLDGRGVMVFGDGPHDTLALAVEARLERTSSTLHLAPGSRMLVGAIPIQLTGSLETTGPRARVALVAADLGEDDVLASVPAPMLGPLTQVKLRGTFGYVLSFDVDLARPDSVSFHADVVPHGLVLDPARTTLPLTRLDQPFTATIHLPKGRTTTRLLAPDNPHFRTLDQIDSTLVHAVVTNEDGGFFRHRGFNTDAMRAAFAENLRAGAYRRGAGTITMQLARNLWLGHERTLSRKGQEVVLAWILEHLTGVPKRRLLEIYLNIIEWGPAVHGADEASRFYFDHDAGSLTVPEALFLATVVPAPSRWRWRFDDNGELRRFTQAQMHFIGRAMVAKGWLDPAQLPGTDSLRVELRGPARDIVMPEGATRAPGPPGVPTEDAHGAIKAH